MKPPVNAVTYDTPISIHWVDEDGIMFALSKNVERTVPYYEKVIEVFSKFTENGQNKLCLLSYLNVSLTMNKDVRDYVTDQLPRHIKAHAIVSPEPLQPTQTNIFLKLSMSGFPVNVFTSEKEALAWLKEYL